MSKKSVMVWAWVVGAKGQFNESCPTSANLNVSSKANLGKIAEGGNRT